MYLAILATLGLHIAVLSVSRWQTQTSNITELTAALLVLWVCLTRMRQAADIYYRAAWLQLSVAFALYTAAQGYYTWWVIWKSETLPYPSPADFLWLMFAFPILLVTVKRRSGSGWQWVDWLDAAQACIFFFLIYVLVFSHPAAISVSLAFDLQSAGLILAWAIRFSSVPSGKERRFFRDIGWFLIVYAVLSSLGDRWQQHGPHAHRWVGLCWSTPLLFFCTLIVRTSLQELRRDPLEQPQTSSLPRHLHGVSALALSVMSITVAATLALHHSLAGIVAVTIGFLLFAVRTCIREAQLHVAHGTLEHAVMHDALTGLANRPQLMAELANRLRAPSAAGSTALLFIDLDRFKLINDSLGHAFGDRLLREVAAILRSVARPGDLVVRLAGDEFVMLLASVDTHTMRELADGLVQRFRRPIPLEERMLHVSVSVGYVMAKPGTCADELLRDADCAMYAAKRQGKNQAQSFLDGAMASAERYLRLERDLRDALEKKELAVHYQPVYSFALQGIQGFEALVRWPRPDGSFTPPGEFIPIAEETGLIVELGRQVLRQACEQVQQWNERYNRRFTISVNVSARQFADPDLLHDIMAVLRETGLPPALLKLEITETVLLSGSHPVTNALRTLRELGIGISLDDFLTGYSSLSYLLEYPCDSVKIDRSFVRALDRDPRRAELVRTVVQLAMNLEMELVAEGVETMEELKRLEDMGCDLIQGFLFSKPLPAEQIESLLTSGLQDAAHFPLDPQCRLGSALSLDADRTPSMWDPGSRRSVAQLLPAS